MKDLEALVDTYGVFLRAEAEALGYNDHAILRLTRNGTFARVRWGSYTLGSTWREMTPEQRYGVLCRAALRRARTRMILSHTSAANEWGAPMWEAHPGVVHLTREDGKAARRMAGLAPHRDVVLPEDVQELNGLLVMSPTRTALELTMVNDVEHSLVEINDFLHRGLTTIDQLRSRFATMNQWLDTLHTDLVLQLASGRCESVAETRVRYLCWAYHLPEPVVNYSIRDHTGREIYRVDFAWPEYGVFLEFDGKEKYLKRRRPGESVVDAVLREKTRESRIVEQTGWRCIRLTWSDLDRPRETAARIVSLMRPAAA